MPSQTPTTYQSPAAIVFDMDGLMFNTEDIYDEVSEQVLAKRGHQFSREVKIKIMGRPGWEAMQIIIDWYGLADTVEQLYAEIDHGFSFLLLSRLQMMPGLMELLAAIEEGEIPKAVATGSSRKFAVTALSHFDLLPRFGSLLTAEDVTKGKPDPEIYFKTARALGVAAEQMVVFEDSLMGSRAAASAGATTVAVPSPFCHDCDFSHAHLVVDSLHDQRVFELLGL